MSDHHLEEHPDEEGETDGAELEAVQRAVRKRLALSQIRQYGDAVLRMRAVEVTAFDDELRAVTDRMIELMHDADGLGLAATQVGILRRFFVFHDNGEDRVLVNPVIVSLGETRETEEEGCLSLGAVRVPVERAVEVTISGEDVSGKAVSYELAGLQARCVQHEVDHLDGKLIIDRTDNESRREALRELRPRLVLTRS
jgi:peptide deformylase